MTVSYEHGDLDFWRETDLDLFEPTHGCALQISVKLVKLYSSNV